ncbi:hypothetical protein HanIR_Chr01g0021331 [Helianthus annuus]|nr:hypothetical protein HanIR_Chr01g0021331 [Helianthus annuus]
MNSLCVFVCEKRRKEKGFCRKKTNSLLLTDCRHLIHLFSCRCLQMWSADCRPFAAEKTNNTFVSGKASHIDIGTHMISTCYMHSIVYCLFAKCLDITL